MVLVFNSRSVKSMDEKIKEQIIAAGVPLSVYTDCRADLGPSNRSALKRFANLCSKIYENDLPIPPSPFIEYAVDRTTGESRQDFTGIVDGDKGTGKSRSTGYVCGRYAVEVADRWGQDPKDYFSLDNCAMLEDTDGIAKILDEADKHQAIQIDDASVAVSSRDFAQTKNKNFNKIMTVCRTKRWFVVQNAPMSSHIDLQQRELMNFTAHLYKSFHEGGFNILKINSNKSQFRIGKKHYFEKRFSFFDKKFDFWCSYSIDRIDCFKGFTEKYEKQREEAANRIISEVKAQETERKNPNKETKREKEFRVAKEKHGKKVLSMLAENKSARQITRETGLTDHMINRIVAEMKAE